VVALDDIIGDVKSDYPEADIKSSTVDGKIYQVKMVDDMGCSTTAGAFWRRQVCSRRPPSMS
jgi:ABC-type glycerol-3-phosphate transport system substrate-binding protein